MYMLTDAQAALIHRALSDTIAHYATSRNNLLDEAMAVMEGLDHEGEDDE